MKKLKRKELEAGLDEMISSSLDFLQELHIIHSKTPYESMLTAKVPGLQITLAKLIHNLFNIIRPVLDLARRRYPAFFTVIDWAYEIVKKLLRK